MYIVVDVIVEYVYFEIYIIQERYFISVQRI